MRGIIGKVFVVVALNNSRHYEPAYSTLFASCLGGVDV